MKLNNKGIAEVVLLYFVIAGLALLFVPNPVSNAVGVGIRPNKTVQSTVEKVDLIKNADGTVIGTKTITSTDDKETQQHVTFFQWLASLPLLAIVLMGLGIACPAVAMFFNNLWGKAVAEYKDLTGETKRIVVSVKLGLATLDTASADKFKAVLSAQQDSSTKDLVKELLKSS